MNSSEIIRKKRNGLTLSRDELSRFVDGYARGEIPDYQMSAFLMAVYFRGMNAEESALLTQLMLHSGAVVDLSMIPGTKVDKHSTGGVGDKVSLILSPMVAACGVPVPMISGRGLGHTGGTLDKLESIPGFRTNLTMEEYKEALADVGAVMIGQTAEIDPADRRMYALRDVTATIESIPLIVSSILSKKLAEGINALVLDVKTGNGAFMEKYDDAVTLATALVEVASLSGLNTMAFITSMDQPLGFAVGNWCEVLEVLDCLKGKPVADLMEVTFVLGGAMLLLGGVATSIEEGMQQCRSAIWSGKAYEKFLELVHRQGGDTRFLLHPETYPPSSHRIEVRSQSSGYVSAFDTRRIGLLAVDLGAGRHTVDDAIDPRAGIIFRKKIGDHVEVGETLAGVTTEKSFLLNRAETEIRESVYLTGVAPTLTSTIRALVTRDGVSPWATPEQH